MKATIGKIGTVRCNFLGNILPDCLCCGLDQGQVVFVVFKNWGGCFLTWTDVGAVSYLCAVGHINCV